jgi:hypothetical protein
MDVKNYSIGIAKNEHNVPVCLLLSYDSLPRCGEIAVKATSARVLGDDLYLTAGNEVLVLKCINQACLLQIKSGLPIVVIDPVSQRENMIRTD